MTHAPDPDPTPDGTRWPADVDDLSEEEVALIVAMQGGFEPRPDDPLVKALQARGLARTGEASGRAWSLSDPGAAYRPA